MPQRGRKPKPTATRAAEGNPGRRPLNQHEPRLPPKAPPCPRHLDAEAKREWKRVVKLLGGAGIITQVDRGVLSAYCRAWSLYVEADRAVQRYGLMLMSEKKVPYQSPYLNTMTAALKDVRSYAAELGMTPSARSRVQAAGGEGDGFDAFTAGARKAK